MAAGWWVEAFAYTRARMQQMVSAALGDTYIGANTAARMQQMTSASGGWMEPKGDVGCRMQQMTAAATGTQEVPATAAATMQPMAVAAHADVVDVVMTAAATMKPMQSAAAATETYVGTAGALMQLMTAALAGAQSLSGAVAALMKQMVSSSAGSQSVPPAFDSKSVGATTYGASDALSITTVAASATVYAFFTAVPSPVVGATCDGVAMTQAGTISGGELTCWKATVAPGSHSISGNTAGAGNPSGFTGFAIAYANVTSTSAAQTLTGTTTAASQSVTLNSGKIILQAFGAYNGSASGASFGSPTGGTNRYNGADGNRTGLCVSDATATTTFAATGTPSYYNGWGALAFLLS